MNIFYPLTYEDSVDLDTIKDSSMKMSFQSQIAHFGQTPSQIFRKTHTPRGNPQLLNLPNYNKLISDGGEMRIYKA